MSVTSFWQIVFCCLTVCMLTPQAEAFTIIELKDAAFSYSPDTEPFFAFENDAAGDASNSLYTPKANGAYESLEKASSEAVDLTSWSAQNSPSPRIFRIRMKVKNYGNEASHPTPFTIQVSALVGQFLVDPQALIVDQDYLHQTATWMPLQTLSGSVPLLGRNETMTFYTDAIRFGNFIHTLHHQFPIRVKAIINFDHHRTIKVLEIPVYASHFSFEQLH